MLLVSIKCNSFQSNKIVIISVLTVIQPCICTFFLIGNGFVAQAIEVAVLYDHQANRNLELALARYSRRFKVNRLLGGLQKPKIQQIQQHLKEVCFIGH